MRSTNTFTIIFWADRKNARNEEALIYARITVNQKRANISLKRRVPLGLWDIKKNRCKGSSPNARQINEYLDQTYTKFFQIYQDLKYAEKLITSQLIKAHFVGDNENDKTLQNLIDYHHSKIKNTLAKGTIRNFGVTQNYIAKFLNKRKKTNDVYLRELDFKFLCDFENFLSNYWPSGPPNSLSQNTIMKHIQRLRKMVTLAYHIEWIEKDPFVRWKPVFEKREREFLSEKELSDMEIFEFTIDRLDRVRDLFVFSCYTGISYVDIVNLTQENVVVGMDGNDWIFTRRKKTKSPVKVPLLEGAKEIIEKYRQHPMTMISGTLFPVITNEKLNAYLKEVAHYVGIKKNLTFHMARHTFATTVTLSNGVPIETVSKLLGHSKLASTQIYARVIDSKISNDMEILRKRFKQKKDKVIDKMN